jgi:hypothetical protein
MVTAKLLPLYTAMYIDLSCLNGKYLQVKRQFRAKMIDFSLNISRHFKERKPSLINTTFYFNFEGGN